MPSQSVPLQQPEAGDLEQARYDAFQRVAHFQRERVDLEVKRMANSEVGSTMWETICAKYFDDDEMRSVCSLIDNANSQIDHTFMASTEHYLHILDEMRTDINRARTVGGISRVLQAWERSLTWISERRKTRAVEIMQGLRRDLDEISSSFELHDDWYPAFYRIILGLTPDGNYHPNPIPDNPSLRIVTQEYFSTVFNTGSTED